MDEMVELVSVLDLSPEKAKEIFFKSIMRDTYKKEGKYGEGKSNC